MALIATIATIYGIWTAALLLILGVAYAAFTLRDRRQRRLEPLYITAGVPEGASFTDVDLYWAEDTAGRPVLVASGVGAPQERSQDV